MVRLVFKKINAVLPAYTNSNHLDQYQVKGVPKGEKVLLLAYALKDNEAIFGYKEIILGESKLCYFSLFFMICFLKAWTAKSADSSKVLDCFLAKN